MAECIHFPDQPDAVCSICNPKHRVMPTHDPWLRGIEARFHGTCFHCGGSIYKGELIQADHDGWSHVDCEAEA